MPFWRKTIGTRCGCTRCVRPEVRRIRYAKQTHYVMYSLISRRTVLTHVSGQDLLRADSHAGHQASIGDTALANCRHGARSCVASVGNGVGERERGADANASPGHRTPKSTQSFEAGESYGRATTPCTRCPPAHGEHRHGGGGGKGGSPLLERQRR